MRRRHKPVVVKLSTLTAHVPLPGGRMVGWGRKGESLVKPYLRPHLHSNDSDNLPRQRGDNDKIFFKQG